MGLFTIIGLLFTAIGIYVIIQGQIGFGVIWTLFSLLFVFVGFKQQLKQRREAKELKEAMAHGKKHLGTIINYEDDWSVQVNGVPYAYIVVTFTPYDKEVTAKFKTYSTNPGRWPIGSTVRIYEYNNKFHWDRECVNQFGKTPSLRDVTNYTQE